MSHLKPSLLLLFSFVLISCQIQEPHSDRSQPNSTASNDLNCNNDFQTKPAGWHRMGSVGGVGLHHPSVLTIKPEHVAGPGYLAKRLSATGSFKRPSKDVVIVVADDFGKIHNRYSKSVYTVDESLFSLSLESLGSIEPGQSERLRKALAEELDSLLERAQLSHGALTFNMLVDLLSRVSGVTPVLIEAERVVFGIGEARITVQAAEVSGLATPEIAAVLEQIVDDYTEKGVSQFVFNFSFTLESCSNRDGRSRSDGQATSFSSKSLKNDPLYKFIHSRDSSNTKLFLASSGNSGQKEAAQPANWPAVVGVSASKVKPLNRPQPLTHLPVLATTARSWPRAPGLNSPTLLTATVLVVTQLRLF